MDLNEGTVLEVPMTIAEKGHIVKKGKFHLSLGEELESIMVETGHQLPARVNDSCKLELLRATKPLDS